MNNLFSSVVARCYHLQNNSSSHLKGATTMPDANPSPTPELDADLILEQKLQPVIAAGIFLS
jgi:hypothetical protein